MGGKAYSNRLIDILDIYKLKQLITEPTRIINETNSLIDLHVFITNNPQNIISSGVIPILIGISDHYTMFESSYLQIPT